MSGLNITIVNADADAAGRRARQLFGAVPQLLCAESVLLACAEALGVRSPLLPRLATGFCSGLARTGGTCGALAGGVMALGLALGRSAAGEDLDRPYAAVQEFRVVFVSRFGSDRCSLVCGCRLDTDAGRLAFASCGARERCLDVVEQSATLALRILAELRP